MKFRLTRRSEVGRGRVAMPLDALRWEPALWLLVREIAGAEMVFRALHLDLCSYTYADLPQVIAGGSK